MTFSCACWLAAEDYEQDRVRLAETSFAGFTHIVTTRKGLFAVRQGDWKLLAYGQFFGIALREGPLCSRFRPARSRTILSREVVLYGSSGI